MYLKKKKNKIKTPLTMILESPLLGTLKPDHLLIGKLSLLSVQ